MQTLRLLTTEKKLRLLEGILFSHGEKVLVRAIAKKLDMNPGYVSILIKKMEVGDIVEKGRVNDGSPRVRSLKIVLNIDKVTGAWEKLKRRKIRGFGVFGSWAKGTNSESSDLDAWIKTDKELGAQDISEIRKILRDETGATEVSLIAFTNDRITEIKEKDPLFYSTLLNSFYIGGEQVD